MSQLVEDLRAARDLLEAKGWCQGKFANPDGEVCLDGALYIATEAARANPGAWGLEFLETSNARYTPARLAVAFEIGGARDVWGWNDTVGRTAAEVKDVLERAIARAEAAEGETSG